MKYNFHYFFPTVCHRRNIAPCLAGTVDSIDGVATWFRVYSWIWTPWGGGISLSPTFLGQPGAHPAMFTVRNGPSSWEYRSLGMELITHPSLVLTLRISTGIPLLLLCATIGMLWSDLYLLHMCGWLFVYRHKRKATNNKSVKSKEFTKKFCFFLSSSSYWEIEKRAQLNVLFQNITLMFF